VQQSGIGSAIAVAATLAAAMLPGVAVADTSFPARLITVVVPYAAGGGVDLMMRQIVRKVEETGNVKIVIENRAGAGGTIGAHQVSRAAPDGYTLIEVDATTHAASTYLVKKLPYDPLKDFQPITLFYYAPPLLFVRSNLPVKSVADIGVLARKEKGGLSYATQGLGTNGHLMGALLQKALDAPLVAVPYNSSATLRQDLAAGRVDMIFSVYGTMLGELAAGTVKPIAVAAPSRLRVRPDIPTMKEEGFENIESASWWGLAGPLGMDPAVVKRLNEMFAAAIRSPDVAGLMNAQGMTPSATSPQEFHDLIGRSIDSLGGVMKQVGVVAR
jgi:tripartite-type tricarboxylate transporter receptor subunit TctC